MKKKITQLEVWKRIRKSWGLVNPCTKVQPNKKKKSRAQNKRNFRKQIKDEI